MSAPYPVPPEPVAAPPASRSASTSMKKLSSPTGVPSTYPPYPSPFPSPSRAPSERTSRVDQLSYAEADSTVEGGLEPSDGGREGTAGEELHEGQALPPVDGGRGAWSFVAVAFLLETFIWGYSYSFATILTYLESHPPWSSQSIGSLTAVGTTQLGLQFILPLFVLPVFRRYPEWVKTMLWTSVGVNCGSMLLSGWATEVWELIVLQGVLVGTSGAVLYTPVFAWMGDWFVVRRGLASGIIFAGTGAGGFAFPFLISHLLSLPAPSSSNNGSFGWMARAWALITFVVFSGSVYVVKPRVPPPRLHFRETVRGWVGGKGEGGGRRMGRERGPWMAGYGEVKALKNPLFLVMAFSALLSSLSTLPVSLNLGLYTSSLTSSPFLSDLSVSLFNLAASLGCAVTGYASDYSYAGATSVCGLAGAVLAVSAWARSDSLGEVYAFAVVFGLFSQQVAAWSASARDVGGANPQTSSLVFCILSLVRGVASIVLPFVTEGLYDKARGGERAEWGAFGFRKMIFFVGITGFLSSLGGLALSGIKLYKKRKERGTRTRLETRG
ncbi:hypothetical protein JCM8547_003812 [Rhodosporidiobolus lusitaniae]